MERKLIELHLTKLEFNMIISALHNGGSLYDDASFTGLANDLEETYSPKKLKGIEK